MLLYIDGGPKGARELKLQPLVIDRNGLVVGQDQDRVGGGFDVPEAFNGLIDDLRFYSRVLSAEEVGQLARGYEARRK